MASMQAPEADYGSRLPANRVALAAATTMGIAYVACAAAFALAPRIALEWLGWLFHFVRVDAFSGDVGLTAMTFLAGLTQAIVYTYVFVLLFAVVFNGFARVSGTSAPRRSRRHT